MSVQTVVLGIASVVLPPRHRARWREEASAVLMEVSGLRRFWYTVDTVLKVPILAREHRRGQADGLPGRAIAAVVGAALLVAPLAMVADLLALYLLRRPGVIGFEVFFAVPYMLPMLRVSEPLGYLLVMAGLFALVVTRSFRVTQRHGAGLQYADSRAVLITALVGAGPVLAWPVGAALDLPVVALVGTVLPGVWLAVICAMALHRRIGPWPLAVVGTMAGVALVGALGYLPFGQMMPGRVSLALLIGQVSLMVAAPTYLTWSMWAGARLLLGRQDLLTATSRPGGA